MNFVKDIGKDVSSAYQGGKRLVNKVQNNKYVQKAEHVGKYAIDHPEDITKFGADLAKNVGTDAAEGAAAGTVEPGGGNLVGGLVGGAVGVGQTVWDHWKDVRDIAEA